MTKHEIIDLIKRRKDACELALHDLYSLPIPPEDKSLDIVRLEEEIETYKRLLLEIY